MATRALGKIEYTINTQGNIFEGNHWNPDRMSAETRKKVAKELIESGEMMLKDMFLMPGGWKHFDVPAIKKTVSSRIRLLIKRLACGEDHYLGRKPKITRTEAKKIEEILMAENLTGVSLQIEMTDLGNGHRSRVVFPRYRGEFRKAAVALGFAP